MEISYNYNDLSSNFFLNVVKWKLYLQTSTLRIWETVAMQLLLFLLKTKCHSVLPAPTILQLHDRRSYIFKTYILFMILWDETCLTLARTFLWCQHSIRLIPSPFQSRWWIILTRNNSSPTKKPLTPMIPIIMEGCLLTICR